MLDLYLVFTAFILPALIVTEHEDVNLIYTLWKDCSLIQKSWAGMYSNPSL